MQALTQAPGEPRISTAWNIAGNDVRSASKGFCEASFYFQSRPPAINIWSIFHSLRPRQSAQRGASSIASHPPPPPPLVPAAGTSSLFKAYYLELLCVRALGENTVSTSRRCQIFPWYNIYHSIRICKFLNGKFLMFSIKLWEKSSKKFEEKQPQFYQ